MRGLVLSGGGAYGAFEWGVLGVIAENDLDYAHHFGVSAGALHSVKLAQYPVGQMREAMAEDDEIWFNVKRNKDIYKRWWFLGQLEGLLWRRGLVNSAPLLKIIKNNCDEEAVRASGKTLRLGCTSFGEGLYHEATEETPELWKWVAASSAFAPYFPPIEINGDWWMDGGYRCITPLKSAIAAGCTDVDVVITSPTTTLPEDPKDCKTALDVGMRNVGMMTDEIFKRDVGRVEEINKLVESGHPLGKGKRKINVRLFKPEHHLKGGSRNFAAERLLSHREHGIEVARKILGL